MQHITVINNAVSSDLTYFWRGSGSDLVLLSCTATKDTSTVVQVTSAGTQSIAKRYVRIQQKQPRPLLFHRDEKDQFLMQKW